MKLVIAFVVLMALLYAGALNAQDGFLPYQAGIHGQEPTPTVDFVPPQHAFLRPPP